MENTGKIFILERSYDFDVRLFKTADIDAALNFILESSKGCDFYDYEDCKEEIASNVEDGFDTFVYLDVFGNCVNCEVFACNSL